MTSNKRGSTSQRNPSRAQSGPKGRIVPLYKRSSSHFRKVVRERGVEHVDGGGMQFEVDGTRVRARVDAEDEGTFSVGIDWTLVPEKRALHTFCDCPRFASGEPCDQGCVPSVPMKRPKLSRKA